MGLHTKFREDQSHGSRDMLRNRQTDKVIAILHSPTGRSNDGLMSIAMTVDLDITYFLRNLNHAECASR